MERVQEYSAIEQEPPAIVEGHRPPDGVSHPVSSCLTFRKWPSHGEVRVSGLEIKYAPELPPVLKDLNFVTQKYEKIGVVGRTGAGKRFDHPHSLINFSAHFPLPFFEFFHFPRARSSLTVLIFPL